jgi:hypothetical protein
MVGGIRAWPVISTVTAKPVSLITANRPRLIPEGTVSVIAPSGGSPPSGSRSKKKYRRSSVLVSPRVRTGHRDRELGGERGVQLARLVVDRDLFLILTRSNLREGQVVAHGLTSILYRMPRVLL